MLGIVVLNYMNWKVTIECIDSILKNEFEEEIQIFLLDNGSSNDSIQIFTEKYKNNSNIKILSLKENYGFARANNIGIDECIQKHCQYCLLANSDIILRHDTLAVLVSEMKEHKDAVIIGPRILNSQYQNMPSSFLEPVRIIDALEIGRIFPRKRLNENDVQELSKVYTVSGCCFMIDCMKFKKIGAFDENTFLYNEEDILGMQIQGSPYTTYFCPKTEVIHKHAASSGKRNDFVVIEFLKSYLYYWKEYRNMKRLLALLIVFIYNFKYMLLRITNKNLHPVDIWKESVKIWINLYEKKA